jgi:hypothetical protein
MNSRCPPLLWSKETDFSSLACLTSHSNSCPTRRYCCPNCVTTPESASSSWAVSFQFQETQVLGIDMGPKNSSWRSRCLPDFPNLDSSPHHSFADIGREVAELTGRLPTNRSRLEMEPKLPCDRRRRHVGFRRKLFVDRCYTHGPCLSQTQASQPPSIQCGLTRR